MQGPIPAQMERKVLLKLQEKQLPRHAQAGHLRSTERGWEPQGSGASKTLVARRVRYLPPLFLIGPIIAVELPRFGGQFWAWESSHISVFFLVVHRRQMSERRMPPVRVVKSFDVVENGQSSLHLAAETAAVDELALERGKEALT